MNFISEPIQYWRRVKKTIRKIKGQKKKRGLMGKPAKPVNLVTRVNTSNPQTRLWTPLRLKTCFLFFLTIVYLTIR
jgi:hypothetical protein